MKAKVPEFFSVQGTTFLPNLGETLVTAEQVVTFFKKSHPKKILTDGKIPLHFSYINAEKVSKLSHYPIFFK